MGEPNQQSHQVVEMVDYLRETLAEIDEAIADLNKRRLGIAVRLAVIASANDPVILAAAEDYAKRVKEGRPYEDVQDAAQMIMELHGQFSN